MFQDDIAAQPAAVLDALAAHLGIDAGEFRALPAEALGEVVVPGLGDGVASTAPPPLRPSLLGPLLELYGSDIPRLERLTGRDLSAWRQGGGKPPSGDRRTSTGSATRAADAAG